jgi:hypothetical protein
MDHVLVMFSVRSLPDTGSTVLKHFGVGTYHESYIVIFILLNFTKRDWDTSVGIATRCGMDGPGIESQLGRDYPHLSRPTLGPIQPPLHGVPDFFSGV